MKVVQKKDTIDVSDVVLVGITISYACQESKILTAHK